VKPVLSSDGRYAAFQSGATNLVPGDMTAGIDDIFVRAADHPAVSVTSPATGAQGETIAVDLLGVGFIAGAPADVSFGTGVHVESATSDDTAVHVQITIDPSAPIGPRTVTYAARGTGPGAGATTAAFCGNCFTVTASP
jgi:hypothetical protein